MTRDHGPLDHKFEAGYIPMDEPPGLEEIEYRRWKASGGRIRQDGCSSKSEEPQNPQGIAHCHMTARQLLGREIPRLQNRAAALESLLRALPMELPPEADEALFDIVMRSRRGD